MGTTHRETQHLLVLGRSFGIRQKTYQVPALQTTGHFHVHSTKDAICL